MIVYRKCLRVCVKCELYAVALCVIVSRGVRLMAKINTFVTLLKILAIIFIVTVGLVAISRRGTYIYLYILYHTEQNFRDILHIFLKLPLKLSL